jgi:hypothetical protein
MVNMLPEAARYERRMRSSVWRFSMHAQCEFSSDPLVERHTFLFSLDCELAMQVRGHAEVQAAAVRSLAERLGKLLAGFGEVLKNEIHDLSDLLQSRFLRFAVSGERRELDHARDKRIILVRPKNAIQIFLRLLLTRGSRSSHRFIMISEHFSKAIIRAVPLSSAATACLAGR